jgi:hypothetical protein
VIRGTGSPPFSFAGQLFFNGPILAHLFISRATMIYGPVATEPDASLSPVKTETLVYPIYDYFLKKFISLSLALALLFFIECLIVHQTYEYLQAGAEARGASRGPGLPYNTFFFFFLY